MTSPAIQLARECGMQGMLTDVVTTHAELETFYARAQAQALRDAADWFFNSEWVHLPTCKKQHISKEGLDKHLHRIADELENKA